MKNVIDIMLNCVTNVKEYNPLLRRFIDIETTCSSEKCHIQNCVYCTLNNVICTERDNQQNMKFTNDRYFLTRNIPE